MKFLEADPREMRRMGVRSMNGQIRFFVPGTPVTEGSTKYVGHRGARPVLLHDNHAALKAWRDKISDVAVLYARQAGWTTPLDEPVCVAVTFRLPKPKRPAFDKEAATKPDLDKLQRAVGDALGKRLLREDSRIVGWHAEKRYVDTQHPAGVDVTIIRKGVPF